MCLYVQVGSIAGLDAYIAEPKEKPTAAILLITDIFGWEVKNVRIVADKYADAGKHIYDHSQAHHVLEVLVLPIKDSVVYLELHHLGLISHGLANTA